MRQQDTTVSSVPNLLTKLLADRPPDQPLWFRGQADSDWKLVPSLLRPTGGISRELMLIKKFKQHALAFLDARPQGEWEWLFLMQHHSVPTRLLDWTENPLAGLYFAACECPETDGALWCLLPVELNKSSRLEVDLENDIPGFDSDDVLDQYLPSKLHTTKMVRLMPAAAIAARNSGRMQAQAGAFTVFHRDEQAIEYVGQGEHVWRYVIPKSDKQVILKELYYLNVHKLSLFPELQSVGDHVRGLF